MLQQTKGHSFFSLLRNILPFSYMYITTCMIGIDMKNTDELKKIDRKVEAKVKGATAVLF